MTLSRATVMLCAMARRRLCSACTSPFSPPAFACAAGWEYEYAQHLKIGEEFGISSDDLAAVALETQGLPNCLDPLARLIMRAAREMTLGEAASDETMRELQATLSTEHLVDLIFAIAFYVGFGRITSSFLIEVEPQRRIYLERFPMPNPARR